MKFICGDYNDDTNINLYQMYIPQMATLKICLTGPQEKFVFNKCATISHLMKTNIHAMFVLDNWHFLQYVNLCQRISSNGSTENLSGWTAGELVFHKDVK